MAGGVIRGRQNKVRRRGGSAQAGRIGVRGVAHWGDPSRYRTHDAPLRSVSAAVGLTGLLNLLDLWIP